MYLKVFTIALLFGLVAISVEGQVVDEFALSRLPVLSKTIAIENAFSPDLPVDKATSVPCFDGSRTVDTQTPWIWCYGYDRPTEYIRPQIRVGGYSNDQSWYLLIKTETGREVDRLNASSFHWKDQGPDEPSIGLRWTERVPGRGIQIELHADSNPHNLHVSVDQVNVSFFQPGPKAITTRKNDMRDLLAAVKRDHVYYAYSRSIADIHLMMPDGSNRETNCTGFLLTRELLMTNQHCISQDWQLDNAIAIFGFESQPPAPTPQDEIPFIKIEMQDEVLDFAILRLKWPARDVWRPATIDSRPITANQQLLLIQHPNDKPKVLSLIECTIQAVKVEDRPKYSNDFYHLCDCEGGASGAPMIDEKTGRVVGIHHREIQKLFDDGINLAVRMNEIVAKIRTNEELFNQIKNSIQ
ncbi:MAG TPA: serine protease [Pyrinomonadaceae bacterium]|nr:serine protease [Pyrinomonadaceae bacterium]